MSNTELLDLIGIERARAKRGFKFFVEDAWHVIEPPDQVLIWGWVMDAICDHLEAVTQGHIHNLLMNVPPGFSKSVLTNVYWPAYEWIQRPHLKYMSFAYDQRLSLRDNRRCRELIRSKWYQERWGHRVKLTNDQATKDNYVNMKGGWRIATTIGGSYATGERANRLIVDDPHSVKTAMSDAKRQDVLTFRRETLPSRLINPSRDAKICIMQRLHDQDYSGDSLSKEHGDPDLVHLMIPMRFDRPRRCFTIVKPRNPIPITDEIRYEVELRNAAEMEKPEEERGPLIDLETMYPQDPRTRQGELAFEERFSEEETAKLERSLGPFGCASQLDQSPKRRSGGMFKRALIELIPVMPSNVVLTARAWDLAGTEQTAKIDPDATATVKMSICADGNIVIEHAAELYEDAGLVPRAIRNMASQDGTSVVIGLPQDPAQAGKYQFRMLSKSLMGYRIKKIIESGSKELRAEPFADQWEAGNIKLLKGPWNEMYLSRMEMFPSGKKDITDASSSAFMVLVTWAASKSKKSKGW